MAIPVALASLIGSGLAGGGAGQGSGINPITAALGVPELLYKAGVGLTQIGQGRKLGQTPRPEYEIPFSQIEQLQLARNIAMNPRMPGQSMMEDQLALQQGGAARGIAGLGSGSAERLGALSNLSGNLMNQQRQIGVSAAQQHRANQGQLMNALGQMADQEYRRWQYNVDQPYQDAMRSAYENTNAGRTNIAGSLREGGGLLGATVGTQGRFANPPATTPPAATPSPNFSTQPAPGGMNAASGMNYGMAGRAGGYFDDILGQYGL